MTKLLSFFITCFCILFTFNASADWCRNVSGGGISPCNSAPSSWSDCGTFQGDTVWCYKSGGADYISGDLQLGTNTLVKVGEGYEWLDNKLGGNLTEALDVTAAVGSVEGAAKIAGIAGKTAEKIDNIADAAKTVKNTADNISKVEHNALTAPVKGGSYSQVKNANVGLGGETHHMPAKSVSRIPESKGPAVYLEKVDHKNTASYGNSFNAEHYRQIQKELIDQGKYRDAAAMDIWDIKKNTGTKYNEGLQQSIDYMKTLPEFKK